MIPILCGGNRADLCSNLDRGAWPEDCDKFRTMTADMAERRSNCIGWPLRDGDGRPLWTPAQLANIELNYGRL
jgi:hypothetical protein